MGKRVMMGKFIKWLRIFYNKSIHGIGFYPALLSIVFLIVFIFIYNAEGSSSAIFIKNRVNVLNLRNTGAARTIITTIVSGIIGLMVFSFSMVMVVMSQAASQMSNRILDNLIGNKFQQTTLGFYLGTVMASFYLLSVVDDKGSSAVPSISVFLLVLLTVIDLFLFVSFLHYISQSVRFEKLISIIHKKTRNSMNEFAADSKNHKWSMEKMDSMEINSPDSNYFQGINRKQLLKFCAKYDYYVEFYHLPCTYLVKEEPLLRLFFKKKPSADKAKQVFESIDFYTAQEIDKNPFYGFLHLSEVAIKALSPGINDPNTAVLCIHALTDLLMTKMRQPNTLLLADTHDIPRILLRERSFDEVFNYCIYPIWDYGKKDRFVKNAFYQMLRQLSLMDKNNSHQQTFGIFNSSLNQT